MVLDKFGPYECRMGTKNDIPEITKFLEDLVCDSSNFDMYNMEKRKLNKMLQYTMINGDCILVTKDDKLSAVYTGKGNTVAYMGNKGDLFTLTIMLKIALCDIQNQYVDGKFQVDNKKHKKIYEDINSPNGIITYIDENGRGTIKVAGKLAIKELYTTLRSKYD